MSEFTLVALTKHEKKTAGKGATAECVVYATRDVGRKKVVPQLGCLVK